MLLGCWRDEVSNMLIVCMRMYECVNVYGMLYEDEITIITLSTLPEDYTKV